MKVLRRSFHKDKDRSSSSPPRPDFNLNQSHLIHLNSSKHPPTQPFASLAPNLDSSLNAKAIVKPPTLVIKAITTYKPNRITELSFQKGDFFHVVGERDDHQGSWFEASNPATGARGIVPKHCFEIFGPKQHEPPPSKIITSSPIPPSSQPARNSNQTSNPSSSPSILRTPTSAEASRSSKPQPLYGIVQHDFVAERPDELDAKRGEPIIVIAQSNHEWFVAKPIGRLGGPGLIPVTFVEVQDVTTGKPLAPNQVQELINSSVVPKVEEWKKATAAYKGNSIPLGKFDFTALSPPAPSGPLPHHRSSRSASVSNTLHSQNGSWHSGHGDLSSFGESRQASLSRTPWDDNSRRQSGNGYSHDELNQEPGPDGDGYATVDELRERYGVVVHASVESFHFEQGHYWFHLRAHFSKLNKHNNTNDESNNQTTTVLVLYRLYEDFYDFQAALLESFPEAPDRKIRLPKMPGPTKNVDELVCSQRVEDLSKYLHDLCELPLEIRESELVYEFLGPREGDVELEGDPGNLGLDSRTQLDVEGEVVEYLHRMQSGHGDDQMDGLNQSIARLSTGSNVNSDSHRHQRQPSHGSSSNYPSRFSKNSTASRHNHLDRSQDPRTFSSSTVSSDAVGLSSSHTSVSSSFQMASKGTPFAAAPSGQYQHHSNNTNGINAPESNGAGFLRIKIYQRQTDDLIAIRAPNGVTYHELVERIRERVGPEARLIRYRDETGGGYSTGGSHPIPANHGARLVGIDNDHDLERWIASGSRLVLYVD